MTTEYSEKQPATSNSMIAWLSLIAATFFFNSIPIIIPEATNAQPVYAGPIIATSNVPENLCLKLNKAVLRRLVAEEALKNWVPLGKGILSVSHFM